jgi:hypothetical protein
MISKKYSLLNSIIFGDKTYFMKPFFLALMVLFYGIRLAAQDHVVPGQPNISSEIHHPFKKSHSVGLAIGHAHVFEGRDAEGNKKVLALPMWGIDYNFQFSPKWMIGFHTDIITETFAVKKNLANGEDGEVVERSRPVAPAIMGFFKPTHHWNFGLGLGGEFAKEENYFLTRATVEYGAEISKGWEVFGAVQYDFRWNAYDSWTIGIGISKALGKRQKENGNEE